MPRTVLLLSLLLLGTTTTHAQGTLGPDVVVTAVPSIIKTGTVGDITAYALSTLACNLGDQPAVWDPLTNQHPLIVQNLYRLENGRIEQIGMAWLKHAFCATNEPWCGSCAATPCDTMGVNCADTYGAVTNAQQQSLGPRSEVNPYTGDFVYPFGAAGTTGDAIYKRLQVHNSDLVPAQHPTAQYFAEVFYLTTDEAPYGTMDNNASYQQVTVGALDAGGYQLNLSGPTVTEVPALNAWLAADAGVQITIASPPDDGSFHLGSRAIDLGNGLWSYEYALYNYNAHRSAGSFSVPLPTGTLVTSSGFHDVDYHSGEPYSGTDWAPSQLLDSLEWATTPHATNPDANALRWSTLYNFRLVCDQPPVAGQVTIGLFRPGLGSTLAMDATIPGSCTTVPFVRADADADGLVNITDAVAVLGYLFNNIPLAPPVDRADCNGDGTANITDPIYLLAYLFTNGPVPPAPFPDPACL